jgi:hypothetical protein
MPDKPPGLKDVVEAAQAKLKNELEAAANTFAEFSVIGLKHILGHPMFENTLKTLGLQVIAEAAPQPAKPRKTTAPPKPKATAPEADKTAFLAAATKLCAGGKSQRLTKVAKAAKLQEDKAKAAKAALIDDGKLKDSGAWVVLPD